MMFLVMTKQDVRTLQSSLRSRTVDLMRQIGNVQYWPQSKEQKKEIISEMYDEIDRVEDLFDRLKCYE